MLSGKLAGAAVRDDQQSVLPGVRGVPWWGAMVIALALTAIGAAISSADGGLGRWFKIFYVLGCVLAVLAVRRRALFTAAIQPPLVLFAVALVTEYSVQSGSSEGLKGLVINVLLPIAKLFPLMAWTFVVVLALAGGRWYLTRTPSTESPQKPNPQRSATKRPRQSGRGESGRSSARNSSRTARTTRSGDDATSADRPRAATRQSAGEAARGRRTSRDRAPRSSGTESTHREPSSTHREPSPHRETSHRDAAPRREPAGRREPGQRDAATGAAERGPRRPVTEQPVRATARADASAQTSARRTQAANTRAANTQAASTQAWSHPAAHPGSGVRYRDY
ncbi:hypothetical protein GCM10027169_20320 [Gordonia jinhuaensis]|uniref:DUF6542 domain-containing protein n=1 Tax=Gordonia jinhuaensis TaxID=1517702 RepID=A0A916TJ52_9ACTN|nr:DUF6542 domain-containing protein [Gordonia jinhuaensis]GGB43993.1 hypothetical protein GCM10011489_34420 [Gordonia jinhuaensis]